MASPKAASEQLPAESVQAQSPNGEVVNGGVQENAEDAPVAGVEQGMKGLGVSEEAGSALHRACAEGRLDGVREALSRGVESLEVLDASTGCTPIVLAIRNNHPEIVRELLQAGAIVPPPAVTNDQQMLALLYPPHMYGIPPWQQQQQQSQPSHPHPQHQPNSDFYPQPPFYPSQPNGNGNGNGNGMYMPYPQPGQRQHRESDAGQSQAQANLPPADVAKTIPCRNFPNCKYGHGCLFFHPRQGAPFFPQQGFEYEGGFGGFQPGQGFQHFAMPNGEMGGQFQQGQQLPSHPEQGSEETGEAAPANGEQPFQGQPIPAPHHLNSMPPAFIPGFQQPQLPMSPPQFGASPLSPSMLGNSLPSIPPADQFFAAASPPPANGFLGNFPPAFVPMPMIPQTGVNGNRRQSFNQFGVPIPAGPGGGKMGFGGPGKKASFSGGPRPFAPGFRTGPWKDGVPPACMFFPQGKCRSGDMCKFPHIDAEGNDCRHPDLVRGAIPPMPAPRVIRPPRTYPAYDPAFKQQQIVLQQQRAAMQVAAQNGSATSPTGPSEDLSSSQTLTEASVSSEATKIATPVDKGVSTLPPKPQTGLAPAAPVPALIRSASQPGVQRVHANGFNSRSHSPAPSNVSFHGGGHPKRAASRPGFAPMANGAPNGASAQAGANGHGPRSASTDGKIQPAPAVKRNQRVPGADEFPALGGMGGSDSKQASPVARGRTAAEVLSAPAPEKPVVKAPERENSADSGKSDQSIEMDSDNESDGVVISVKPSSSTPTTASTPAPAPAPTTANGTGTAKRPSMSFARMAGGLSSENTPIAVKA